MILHAGAEISPLVWKVTYYVLLIHQMGHFRNIKIQLGYEA